MANDKDKPRPPAEKEFLKNIGITDPKSLKLFDRLKNGKQNRG